MCSDVCILNMGKSETNTQYQQIPRAESVLEEKNFGPSLRSFNCRLYIVIQE